MSTGKPLSPRRRLLLEAAMEVVAEKGLRGLTHRAVDRRAALPEGTCSAYLRTRQALQEALAVLVSSRLTDDVRTLSGTLTEAVGDFDHAVNSTRQLFLDWLNAPSLLIAKLELTLEASRNPALADLFSNWRKDLVTVVAEVLSAAGRDHSETRAEALVAALDGVLMGALLQAEEVRPRYLTDCLGALIAPLVDEAESSSI